MRSELVLELKQLEITLEEVLLEWKKHTFKLKSSKINTPQKYEDFESVRAKHLASQQNYVNAKKINRLLLTI